MLLSPISLPQPLCNYKSPAGSFLFCPTFSPTDYISVKPRPFLLTCASSSSSTANTSFSQKSSPKPNLLRHVTCTGSDDQLDGAMVSSASAVASTIRRASNSPVEFMQMFERDQKSGLVLPSPDFQRLCVEQLDLFRRIVHSDASLSVYVRPAGSYVMDRLELRCVTSYPGVNLTDIVILVGNFNMPAGLRAAEAALSSQQVEIIPEHRAMVFPMVKHPFVVGFLVAELPMLEVQACGDLQSEGHDFMQYPSPEEAYALSAGSEINSWGIHCMKDEQFRMYNFCAEKQLNAFHIARSLAMAYVMDQKSMLLQQSSWQNNIRMSNLVEQIRGPLSSIRILSKMLSTHVKRSEIAHDIVEDIMVQGDHVRDTLGQLQDAVYMTKANIVRYNEETLKKMHDSNPYPESVRNQLNHFPTDASGINVQEPGSPLSLDSMAKDLVMPMPPLALAPLLQHEIRPCNISAILEDMVEAVRPLAQNQQRAVELSELGHSLQVAIEEPALRQALSNLIEGALLRTRVGGKVEIASTKAPAGGALVIIDDDGPDMHYMTQMHSLTPFGDLSSGDRVEDNMTWNFVAGLTVAREILESYGCVVRVISPRITDAALGAGGTRVELWIPSFPALSNFEKAY